MRLERVETALTTVFDAFCPLLSSSPRTYIAFSASILLLISFVLKLVDNGRQKKKYKSVEDVGVPATENLKSQLEGMQVQNADFDFIVVGGGMLILSEYASHLLLLFCFPPHRHGWMRARISTERGPIRVRPSPRGGPKVNSHLLLLVV